MIVMLQLVVARNSAVILFTRLFSSIFLLYSGWQRMAMIRDTQISLDSLYSDRGRQKSYFYLSMAVWIASVLFDVYKVRPFRTKSQPRSDAQRPNIVSAIVTMGFAFNALFFLCYTSVVECLFNIKLNRDNSLGVFFVWSVGMKFIRILLQG